MFQLWRESLELYKERGWKMILENSFKIYTCEHKKAVKSRTNKKYRGIPIFLCEKCKRENGKA